MRVPVPRDADQFEKAMQNGMIALDIRSAEAFAGAFVSAVTSGDFRLQWVPPLWESQFGYSPLVRWAVAFSGGVVLGIGARWADGCTSGHGISGTLQLIVSSWMAAICFFVGGVVIAHIIY